MSPPRFAPLTAVTSGRSHRSLTHAIHPLDMLLPSLLTSSFLISTLHYNGSVLTNFHGPARLPHRATARPRRAFRDQRSCAGYCGSSGRRVGSNGANGWFRRSRWSRFSRLDQPDLDRRDRLKLHLTSYGRIPHRRGWRNGPYRRIRRCRRSRPFPPTLLFHLRQRLFCTRRQVRTGSSGSRRFRGWTRFVPQRPGTGNVNQPRNGQAAHCRSYARRARCDQVKGRGSA